MTKKLFFTIGIAVSFLLLLVSSATADIKFSQTDGVWGRVDDGYDGIVFDVVGVIGNNPGSYWGSGSKTTQNHTLIRNADVCTHDIDGDSGLTDWTSYSPNYDNLGQHTIDTSVCFYQGLFISEYTEPTTDFWGNPRNHAIEIYNNMGETVNLAAKKFSIQIYNNGSSTPTVNIPLTGTIANGATYVITRQTITGVTNQTSSLLQFDGNDAVVLVRDYVADAGDPGPDGQADGATGLMYATGPTGLNPTIGSMTTGTNPSVQTGPTTDFNQVRYGSASAFSSKSGLAFQGINNAGVTYADNTAFTVGKFCHVNNPINATNDFVNTYLTLDLMNMSCGTGAIAPFPPERLTFVYPVNLNETTNSGTCPYPSDPGNPCSDAVTFTPTDASFTCFYDGDIKTIYYVQVLGFMPVGADNSCNNVTYDENTASGIFISQEGSTNCGCLFAMITKSTPTAVSLISFEASDTPEGVLLKWETANETNNLGFNLYRAVSPDGERALLNNNLIQTNVAPGSPFGAVYEYLDDSAATGQTWYYWLEDLDFSGETTFHGPALVTR